ncbi:MAG TPA: UDP-galactopyranose mutase [Phenylobacterium sp.]|uniref:UDP-galactopyranose mutase n=1 Tax=Phenylobacterium sp. TaxID=1871053 RepID=UPI002B495051|nr:UDP-galactopyranose mutase [Phenylobacterium sp.]HKR87345.1 UDP-galactopyranose mutase [Phenylobacterium sp.]
MKTYDWIVVGAGFTGATVAERLASQLDQRVLVIDRRPHAAGNAYDEDEGGGLLVHKYGPHLFHTNSLKVWNYLSRFTEWRPYFHRVLGHVDGNFVPIPFNLDSIAACFPFNFGQRLCEALIAEYGFGARPPILKLRKSTNSDVRLLADYIYEKVFKNYTSKQWDLEPDALDPSVTARVPVEISRDGRYFHDRWQAMPKDGYTAMIGRMLDHKNIDLVLSTDFRDVEPSRYRRVVFTGPIDEFFDYSNGALPYRTIRFEFVDQAAGASQPAPTVNYPNEFSFTRITDQGLVAGATQGGGKLIYEFPEAHAPGRTEPYYPIPTAQSAVMLQPYQRLAADLAGQVWFAGRLGDYAYYNMDQACARALALFEKQLASAAQGRAIAV